MAPRQATCHQLQRDDCDDSARLVSAHACPDGCLRHHQPISPFHVVLPSVLPDSIRCVMYRIIAQRVLLQATNATSSLVLHRAWLKLGFFARPTLTVIHSPHRRLPLTRSVARSPETYSSRPHFVTLERALDSIPMATITGSSSVALVNRGRVANRCCEQKGQRVLALAPTPSSPSVLPLRRAPTS
jgi:hypothetical protein